ncbi:3-demethylubiquinone-9 3-methyltransferase [Achromatium sp. WMS1]|nr:3-demethylubiquinone-9 3-methyltransferase [Achromatium sp. WMS1]
MTQHHTNVDPAELAKFAALASRWWDPNSELKPLHEINPLRLGYVERICGSLKGKMILDVGCGGGLLAESMVAKGATVTGIDLNEAAISVAELHALESGVQVVYQQTSAENFAQEVPASFDIITCMELLEHVPNPASTVAACSELVRPGGWVLFSTLNRNLKSYLFAIIGAEYILGLLPKGTHQFNRFIRPAELSAWSRQVDLKTKDITGISYDPFMQSYCTGRDIMVNYLLACQKDLRHEV